MSQRRAARVMVVKRRDPKRREVAIVEIGDDVVMVCSLLMDKISRGRALNQKV